MLSVAALPSLSLATATVAPRTVARAAAPQMGFGKAELAGAPSPERALASSALAGRGLDCAEGALCTQALLVVVQPGRCGLVCVDAARRVSGRADAACARVCRPALLSVLLDRSLTRVAALPAAALAKEQNPIIGFYDPMGLSDLDLWGQGEEASIGEPTYAACPRLSRSRASARRAGRVPADEHPQGALAPHLVPCPPFPHLLPHLARKAHARHARAHTSRSPRRHQRGCAMPRSSTAALRWLASSASSRTRTASASPSRGRSPPVRGPPTRVPSQWSRRDEARVGSERTAGGSRGAYGDARGGGGRGGEGGSVGAAKPAPA